MEAINETRRISGRNDSCVAGASASSEAVRAKRLRQLAITGAILFSISALVIGVSGN